MFDALTIGSNIRRVRELRNLTQGAVARQLGLTTAAYSNIERGQTEVTLKRLYELAGIFNTDVDSLIHMTEDQVARYLGGMPQPEKDRRQAQACSYCADYREMISHLREEVEFLRTLIRNESQLPGK
ncbi:MAG: helix-turn-helix domain-containing protein [Flavobacteriales bacterium]